jgi:hypothetical protein
MIDEAKFDAYMARLRRGLLADLNARVALERDGEPLVAHELTLTINVAAFRTDATPQMLETAARALEAAWHKEDPDKRSMHF